MLLHPFSNLLVKSYHSSNESTNLQSPLLVITLDVDTSLSFSESINKSIRFSDAAKVFNRCSRQSLSTRNRLVDCQHGEGGKGHEPGPDARVDLEKWEIFSTVNNLSFF